MGLIPRKLIGRLFRSLGYNIEKLKSGDDSKLYNQFPKDSLKNKKFLNILKKII